EFLDVLSRARSPGRLALIDKLLQRGLFGGELLDRLDVLVKLTPLLSRRIGVLPHVLLVNLLSRVQATFNDTLDRLTLPHGVIALIVGVELQQLMLEAAFLK